MGQVSHDVKLKDAIDVVVSGNYAYVAASKVLTVINIENPTNPTIVNRSSDSMISDYYPIEISGDYIYISSGESGTKCFSILDIGANPADPPIVFEHSGFGSPLCAGKLHVSGNYLYNVPSAAYGGFHIYDLSNPINPTLRGNWAPNPNQGQLNVSGHENVSISGNFAYFVGSGGILKIDIFDPNDPNLVGNYPGIGGGDIHALGNYVYTLGGSVLDSSNPGSPTLAGSQTVYGSVSIHASGNNVYYGTNFAKTFYVADVSDPTTPILVGIISDPLFEGAMNIFGD